MEFSKRTSDMVIYYTLAILALASSAFFIYVLSVRDVVLWAKIVYYVWTGFVIGVIIFDIICTNTHEGKRISGMIVYILSVLAVIMAIILYFLNSGAAGLATDFFNLFVSVSIVSLMTTGYMIATWFAGRAITDDQIERE